MRHLTYQRCFNHAGREAAARCPECGRYYCRECISEHEDRVVCAACLAKLARRPLLQRRGVLGVARLAQWVVGLAMAWFFFYLIGEVLISLPTPVHEGTLWQAHWWDKE